VLAQAAGRVAEARPDCRRIGPSKALNDLSEAAMRFCPVPDKRVFENAIFAAGTSLC
jgi:hypothetical protein